MRNTKSRGVLNKKLILFDLDQTLVDVFPFHDKAVQYALEDVFHIKGSLKDIDHSGKTMPVCLHEICQSHGLNEKLIKKSLNKAINLYKKYFFFIIPKNTKKQVLPGVFAFLNINKNNFLGVVTGTVKEPAKKILKNSTIDKFFKVRLFGEDGKDKTELIKKAISHAHKKLKRKFKPGEIFIIGDATKDMIGAKNNKVIAIGVTTGSHSADALKKAGANIVVNSLKDKKIMKFINK